MNNNIIEFTIKNLNLRIDKMCDVIGYNEAKLKTANRNGDTALAKEITAKLVELNATVDGYESALRKMQNQDTLTDSDIDYILKSLKVRMKKLNSRVEEVSNTIKTHKKALKTKQDIVIANTGIGSLTMKHYDDVSINIIDKSETRLKRINASLENCKRAIAIFSALK